MIPATADKYTRDYFLGAVDAETGKRYGAAGAEAFKRGKVDGRYMRFLRTLPLKGKDVLDLGCGRGDVARVTAKRADYVWAIDYSYAACQLTREATYYCDNVDVQWVSIVNLFNWWPADEVYDIIFLLDVIEHIPQMNEVYSNLKQWLKPNGILIIDTPIYKSRDDKDSSDLIPSTQGMHCNKQTKQGLISDLTSHGFQMYSLNVWGKGRFSVRIWLYSMSVKIQTFLWKVGKVVKK